MVSNEVGTIKTDIVKMSSNKKRAATWMNNALDEHSELNYNEFKRKSNDWKDSFLSKAILETYSRYGNKKNLSRRSWYNLRSGMKISLSVLFLVLGLSI